MKQDEVRTLRGIARKVASAESVWRKSAGVRPSESYGAGFAHGMAEMARRIKVGCRTRAKAIEKRRTKKARKR